MKQHLLLPGSILLLILLLHAATAQAQHPLCDQNRFLNEVFSDFNETEDIIYGRNARYNGDSVNLFMDIYQPVGDTATRRPVVILAHGGTFISGDKDSPEVTPILESLARKGYVGVSISYRLDNVLSLPLSDDNAISAVVRAQQDGRAAIRYLRRSFAEMGNPYGIDTSMIFIGGSSAGAVLSVHSQYADSAEVVSFPELTNTQIVTDLGGAEGNSGNPGYSSRAAGVINLCGALGNAEWINTNDPMLISMHGDQDEVVPYAEGAFTFPPAPLNVSLDGSAAMHPVAQDSGLYNRFYTFQGAPHVPYVGDSAYMDTTINFITGSLYEFVCAPFSNREEGLTGHPAPQWKLYPNPSNGASFVAATAGVPPGTTAKVRVMNTLGQVVWQQTWHVEKKPLKLQGNFLNSGIYLVEIQTNDHRSVKRLMVR